MLNSKFTKCTEVVMDGNHSVAEALRQINPDVFGFYPITPTSYIGQKFSEFVANGVVDTEYVSVESEHAAMSVCVGASAAGGRAVTATASQGLLLMTEVLYNAAGMRLPIVLINGNRSLSAPLSIHCDHGDAMAVKSSGFVQLFAKNAQEAYDFMLCSNRIAEDPKVRTPLMMAMDCFHTTHTAMNVLIESDKDVQTFVGEPIIVNPLLDIENPVSHGNFDKPDFYMEHMRAQLEGQLNAEQVIRDVFSDFAEMFKRGSGDLLEEYQTDDAQIAIIVMASASGTVKRAVDLLREKGIKVGVVRPKIFRPFPGNDLKTSLSRFQKVLILDRTTSAGAMWGPLGTEVSQIFINEKNAPEMKNVIFGLGSRETSFEDFAKVIEKFDDLPNDQPEWINLRE